MAQRFLGIRQIALVATAVLTAGTALATSIIRYPPDEYQVLRVGEALKQLEETASAPPATVEGRDKTFTTVRTDLAALDSLGGLHFMIFAKGCDAVSTGSHVMPGYPVVSVSMPVPMLSMIPVDLPTVRTVHLASAVRAFQRVLVLQETPQRHLSLGIAYMNCPGRFTESPWPYEETDFDREARQRAAESGFWNELALAELRKVVAGGAKRSAVDAPANDFVLAELQNVEMASDFGFLDESQLQHSAQDYAAYLIVEILDRMGATGDAAEEERATLAEAAQRGKNTYSYSMPINPAKLPPQPPVIEKLYPISPAGTARAQLYLRAIDAALLDSDRFRDLPILGGERSSEDEASASNIDARMKEAIESNGEAFRLLHAAARGSACRYPMDFSLGPTVGLNHLSNLRGLARLLAFRALYAAEHQDPAGTEQAFLDGLALADSMQDEPVLISQLVRVALSGIGISALEQAIETGALDERRLATLQAAFAPAADLMAGFVAALKGEASSMEIAYSMSLREAENSQDEKAQETRELLENELPLMRKSYERMIAAARLPFAEAQAEMEAAANDPARKIRAPNLGRAQIAFLRMEAQQLAAQAALAVERYRLAHGARPENLDALVPAFLAEVPVDPFDEQPMRMRVDEHSYSIYSVGDDLKDDGGIRDEFNRPTDTVVQVSLGQ